MTNLGEGTQTVPLQVTDLPSGVTATASPSSISVTIGKKKTKTFEVQGEVDSSQLATGYELKKFRQIFLKLKLQVRNQLLTKLTMWLLNCQKQKCWTVITVDA